MEESTRRRFLRTTAVVGGVGIAGCIDGEEEPVPEDDDDTDPEPPENGENGEEEVAYEVWAFDQGTDTGYIYQPADGDGDGDSAFELVDEIDVQALDEVADVDSFIPHMVDFTSDYEYAAVPGTGGAQTLIFRVESRELVAAIDTGPGSHFAGFGPDDSYLQVDVIGEGAIKRVDIDWENEEFDIVDEIDTNELHDEFDGSDPICHQHTGNGYSYHTLGPSYHDGALVVVDTEEFEVEKIFTHDEVPSNCGTVPHPTEDKFYLTAGLPTPTDEDGEPVEGEEGVGEWYVFDTETNQPIDTEGNVVGEDEEFTSEDIARSTEGVDAHGFWFTPDASELWVLNRETNDGLVIDPETDDVIEEVAPYGPAEHADDTDQRDAPDIMWASPDGEYMFVTLRGPNPQSGDPHAATGVNAGFSVLDIETRDIEEVVQPAPDDEGSDFHGIGVVPLAAEGEFTSPVYR